MRKWSIFAILLSGLASLGIWINLVSAISPMGLMISEVQISGLSAQDEFVEIYNNSEVDFDLSVCYLNKYSASGKSYILHHFGEEAKIAPQATFVVAGMDFSLIPDQFYSSNQSLAANNSVALICNEEIQDLLAWGTATVKENNAITVSTDLPLWSYQRIKNIDTDDNALDYIIDFPSPGIFMHEESESAELELESSETIIVEESELVTTEETIIVPPELPIEAEDEVIETEVVNTSEIIDNHDETIEEDILIEDSEAITDDLSESTTFDEINEEVNVDASLINNQVVIDSFKVLINELYPAPNSGEFEYIELYNAESCSVDLNNWYLTDLSGKKFILKNIILLPGEYLLLPYAMTKITLNNDEDQINLYNKLGQWRQGVRYAKATKGKALLLTDDLQWKWGAPSPGMVNVFVTPSVIKEADNSSTLDSSVSISKTNQTKKYLEPDALAEITERETVEETAPILESISGAKEEDEIENEKSSSKIKNTNVTANKTKVYTVNALSEWQTWEANDLLILHGRVILDGNWGITNRCFLAEGNYALPVLCTTLKDQFVLGETIELKAKVYFKNNQFEYLKPEEVDFYDQEVTVTFSDDGQNLSEYQLWQANGIVDMMNKSGRIGQLANDEWVWPFRFPKNYKLGIGDSVNWQAVYYKGENYFLGKALFENEKIDPKNIQLKMSPIIFSNVNLIREKFIGKFYVERGRKAALVHCLKSL